ncbi:hypothetical protein [Sinorhizobium meliloti]|uniref:hypothetical protein n=1 Tax=Rhizobium meliloti TaxID=382 RepID=UPI001F26C450|nr:hypothetical protein [Sinorhizobium meliloti]
MDKTVPPGAAILLDFIRETEVGRSDRASYDVIYGHNQAKLPKPRTAMTMAISSMRRRLVQAVRLERGWRLPVHAEDAAGSIQANTLDQRHRPLHARSAGPARPGDGGEHEHAPEEVAIYCVKNDNALFGSEAEWLEERRGGETRLYEAWIRKSKERIAMFYCGTRREDDKHRLV